MLLQRVHGFSNDVMEYSISFRSTNELIFVINCVGLSSSIGDVWRFFLAEQVRI